MKYGNHNWSPAYNPNFTKRDNNWICKKCYLEVLKPYQNPSVWRVKNRKFNSSKNIEIPKSCEEVIMQEALE